MVLEDGRIIEEGEPEVTVDTVEDVESHSDDGEEDRHIVGGWSRQFHPDRALQAPQPGTLHTHTTPCKTKIGFKYVVKKGFYQSTLTEIYALIYCHREENKTTNWNDRSI